MDWTIRVKAFRDQALAKYERALSFLIATDNVEERKMLHGMMSEATATIQLANSILAYEYERRQEVNA